MTKTLIYFDYQLELCVNLIIQNALKHQTVLLSFNFEAENKSKKKKDDLPSTVHTVLGKSSFFFYFYSDNRTHDTKLDKTLKTAVPVKLIFNCSQPSRLPLLFG